MSLRKINFTLNSSDSTSNAQPTNPNAQPTTAPVVASNNTNAAEQSFFNDFYCPGVIHAGVQTTFSTQTEAVKDAQSEQQHQQLMDLYRFNT